MAGAFERHRDVLGLHACVENRHTHGLRNIQKIFASAMGREQFGDAFGREEHFEIIAQLGSDLVAIAADARPESSEDIARTASEIAGHQ